MTSGTGPWVEAAASRPRAPDGLDCGPVATWGPLEHAAMASSQPSAAVLRTGDDKVTWRGMVGIVPSESSGSAKPRLSLPGGEASPCWRSRFGLAACTGFGPRTMREQQADYAAAVADGGKRQTLLNIVRLRYGDVPAFLSVSQILAGYSLQGTFSAGTELLTGGSLRLSNDANVGVGGTFTNSPTVTYSPVTGADFARTFLAPMQPADLFGLMLGGISPELVLGLGLHSIGGYRQRASLPSGQIAADPNSGRCWRCCSSCSARAG